MTPRSAIRVFFALVALDLVGCSSTAAPGPAGLLPDGGASDDGGGTPDLFGSGMDAGGGAPGPCKNLQCQQTQCAAGAKTSVSGTVFDPAGKIPLYNVVVYVPNAVPDKITDGATCDKCGTLYTGQPVVSALSGPDGKFVLENVPDGANIPLVIQIGKWRRQITIPSVTKCADTPLDNALSRLPRNRTEGDMPKIAISTGGSDSLECLLPRIGVDPAEFTSGDGPERVHVFQGVAGNAMSGGSPTPESSLWNSKDSLMRFDIVALSCEGDENANTKPPAALQAMQDYAGAGGRVFASHFHYYWFSNGPAPFPSTASWTPGSDGPQKSSGLIDQSFPKGMAFDQWLRNVNALNGDGTLAILGAKQNALVGASNKGSQSWISIPGHTEYFTFNTPLAASADQQCGRVVFSDLHVAAASDDYDGNTTVPGGCSKGELSPQEKALEFMLFDLSACLLPDSVPPAPPMSTPR